MARPWQQAGTPVRLGHRKLVEHDGFRGDVISSDISAKQRGVILKRRNTVEEEGSDGRGRQLNPAPTEVAGAARKHQMGDY